MIEAIFAAATLKDAASRLAGGCADVGYMPIEVTEFVVTCTTPASSTDLFPGGQPGRARADYTLRFTLISAGQNVRVVAKAYYADQEIYRERMLQELQDFLTRLSSKPL